MKLALRIGGLGVATAIMTVLVSRLGVEQIADQLALAGPGVLWIFALHAAAMMVTALPWYALLPREIRPTVGGAITSRFVASGASAVIPLVGFAGELARLPWLPKGERAPGVAAIVVDRLMYGAAGVAILAAGLVGLSHVPRRLRDPRSRGDLRLLHREARHAARPSREPPAGRRQVPPLLLRHGPGRCLAFFALGGVGEREDYRTEISTGAGLQIWANHIAFRLDTVDEPCAERR